MAHAAPRVALVVGDAAPAEAAVARVALESAGLEVQAIDDHTAPLAGEDAELVRARQTVRSAAATAHASFVATRYAEARELVTKTAHEVAAWAGHPEIARGIAELELVAAQCGDPVGYAAAAAHDEALVLDPASYSPDVRRAFSRALAERAKLPRARLHVTAPGATVFVDGVRYEGGPLPVGVHTLYASGPGLGSVHRTLKLDRETTLALTLRPVTDLAAALRLHALDVTPVEPAELVSVAQQLRVEAAIAVQLDGDRAVATLAGPSVAAQQRTARGARSAVIGEQMKALALIVRGACALTHTPPEHGKAGRALTLDVTAPPCVKGVSAYFRTSTKRPWSEAHGLELSPIPSSDHAIDLEYYLVGAGDRGYEVSGLRDATTPFRVPLEPDIVRRHWYGRWWIWTVAGVVVAGAVTTAVVLTHRPAEEARLVPSQ